MLFYVKCCILYTMKKWLNIPNTLSILRIVSIPFIVYFIINSNRDNYPILIALYAIGTWLDFFDGYLARKLNQETELGMILDPIADKFIVLGTVVALVIKSDFPILLAAVIVGRDLVILIASFIIMRGRKVVVPALLVGKVTFALMGTMLMVFIIDLHPGLDMLIVKRFFVASTFCFLAWSFLEYYKVYQREKNA